MSRKIDKLALSGELRPTKVIVLSCARNGTLGLYWALKILGFKPYHMIEAVTRGTQQLDLISESIEAHGNPESGMKPYGRDDFDKWWREWDVSRRFSHTVSWRHNHSFNITLAILFILGGQE